MTHIDLLMKAKTRPQGAARVVWSTSTRVWRNVLVRSRFTNLTFWRHNEVLSRALAQFYAHRGPRYLRERFKKNHAWSLDSSSLRDMSFEKVAVESLPHQPESPPTRSSPLSLRMQACGDCADGSPRGQPTGYIRSVRSRAL